MKEIQLTMTEDDTNLILRALGEMPFATVYAVIRKIQEQAQQQLDKSLSPQGEAKDVGAAAPTISGNSPAGE